MRFFLTIHTNSRWNTTSGSDPRGLQAAGNFVSALANADPGVEFTLAADSGPDFTARYGEVTSVKFEVTI